MVLPGFSALTSASYLSAARGRQRSGLGKSLDTHVGGAHITRFAAPEPHNRDLLVNREF